MSGVKKQADDIYAVEITLNAKAEREKNVLFNVELIYGGVFRVKNIPEDQLAPLLLVECPRLIFPFARQVLASDHPAGRLPAADDGAGRFQRDLPAESEGAAGRRRRSPPPVTN